MHYQNQKEFFKSHDGENIFYQHWFYQEAPNYDYASSAMVADVLDDKEHYDADLIDDSINSINPITPTEIFEEDRGTLSLLPPIKHKKKAIIMFHRGHEHSQRVEHIVSELGEQLQEYEFFAWDTRGHGESGGDRGYSPNVAHIVKDMDYFIKYISQKYEIAMEDMIVLGQSVGAVYLATWLHDYAPKVKAAILASPAFKVKLYVPLAIPSLRLIQKFSTKPRYVNSYVKAHFLSHDTDRIRSYNTDKKITRAISVNLLVDLFDTSKRIVADASAIETPILMLVSGSDFVVHKKPQYEFFAKLSSNQKQIFELPYFYHDTLGEKNRALAFNHIKNFVSQIEKEGSKIPNLTESNPMHYSYLELENISKPLCRVEKNWVDMQIKGLKFGAKFSQALQVGEEYGYDSGAMLDYVYQNQATSHHALGKLIDRAYLDAIGWKGIRIRKENLEKAFLKVYELIKDRAYQEKNQDLLKFIDIAAGHGRYDLEFLAQVEKEIRTQSYMMKATLSDYNSDNVGAGNMMIAQHSLSHCVNFVQGNAFDTEYVQNLTDGANLVVVSGLYELYPDNTLINQSLMGISQGIKKGGYLVYTNQPWHPQLKFIAQVLTSHRQGQAWIMRRRTQREMDQLVEKKGFLKIDEYIDEYGIFSVSIAQKL
jgi:alpha-beta hydrolase superfamily lysophospholipase